MPDTVNGAITDAVTQTNTKVLSEAPAVGMGNIMQATSQALAASAQNLATGQQQENVIYQAATVQGINTLMNTGNAEAGKTASQVLEKTESESKR